MGKTILVEFEAVQRIDQNSVVAHVPAGVPLLAVRMGIEMQLKAVELFHLDIPRPKTDLVLKFLPLHSDQSSKYSIHGG